MSKLLPTWDGFIRKFWFHIVYSLNRKSCFDVFHTQIWSNRTQKKSILKLRYLCSPIFSEKVPTPTPAELESRPLICGLNGVVSHTADCHPKSAEFRYSMVFQSCKRGLRLLLWCQIPLVCLKIYRRLSR
jgi:hypothetical protein